MTPNLVNLNTATKFMCSQVDDGKMGEWILEMQITSAARQRRWRWVEHQVYQPRHRHVLEAVLQQGV